MFGTSPFGTSPFGGGEAVQAIASLPEVSLIAVVELAGATEDGRIVEAVGPAWREIIETLARDPNAAYSIDSRAWEELIAGAYHRAGYDEVVLTPRSGDFGRDVVATKRGFASVRIFDQVKAYAPGRVVPANDVRALVGVLTGAQNVSKGVVTTTSTFAPLLRDDPFIKPLLPYRLELRDRDALLPWLAELAAGGK